MKIQFIGTGSGKTSLKRFHSSLLIFEGGYNLLIDCGDGISKALLYNKIDLNLINGILITHFHPDHYSGLASLLIQMKINNRTSGMDIFIHKSNLEYFTGFIFNSYVFTERLGFELRFFPFENNLMFAAGNSLKITAMQNSHLDDYRIYDTKRELGFSCVSLLIKGKGSTLFYTGDIGSIDDLFLFENKKIDVLISEISHVEIKHILKAFRLRKISKVYLTHIGDDDEDKIAGALVKILDDEKDKIVFAYDGMKIILQ